MTDHNKNAATSFLKLASTGEVDEAYSKFVGEGFKHHNAFFEGSPESLMAGMEENARQNPDKLGEVKHAIAEADFVVVHSHGNKSPVNRTRLLCISSGLRTAALQNYGTSLSQSRRNR